ncbi:MAG: DUF554 domain-containing protein [Clostridia bacterium]|nr:DUF554 domain-containing protein [Clostridia bacterium]
MKEFIEALNNFPLTGTIVNAIAVIIGAAIGMLLKKGMSEKLSSTVMAALALCTLYIGVSGSLSGQNTLILIVSMVLGALIGELIDLDRLINRLGDRLQARFASKDGSVSVAEGFVTASLLFCVGAMTVVGSMQSGAAHDHTTLYAKSLLDFAAAIIFASQLGFGVFFSAAFVLVYQGALSLLAVGLGSFLSDAAIAEMTCAGSVIIVGLALNMLKITKLRVMNFLPAIFIAPAISMLTELF